MLLFLRSPRRQDGSLQLSVMDARRRCHVLQGHVQAMLRQCFESGSPEHLDENEWPLRYASDNGSSLEDQLCGRPMIVMSSTLGNHTPPVPLEVMKQCSVIQVRNCTSALHYGFRTELFVVGHRQTWQDRVTEAE